LNVTKLGTKYPLHEENSSATKITENQNFSSQRLATIPAAAMYQYDPYTRLPLHQSNSYTSSPHLFSTHMP
jgi:hypothetical protein